MPFDMSKTNEKD